ncbi:MAG: glutaredoxin family protein [Pyrinomonadaceae bacterium]
MKDSPKDTAVTLYVVADCPLCAGAREWLEAHQVSYEERDVTAHFGALRDMYRLTKQRLVPVFERRKEALVRPTATQLTEFLL